MAAEAVVETRMESDVRDRAAAVLEGMGVTLSDAVRLLLTQVADDGSFPFPAEEAGETHDAWFRASVQQALDDRRPTIPKSEVEAHFAERRRAAMGKVGSGQP